MKLVGSATLFLALATLASAVVSNTPEIDSSSATSAVAILVGGFLIARSRRKN